MRRARTTGASAPSASAMISDPAVTSGDRMCRGTVSTEPARAPKCSPACAEGRAHARCASSTQRTPRARVAGTRRAAVRGGHAPPCGSDVCCHSRHARAQRATHRPMRCLVPRAALPAHRAHRALPCAPLRRDVSGTGPCAALLCACDGAMPRHATPRHAMPCRAVWCRVVSCGVLRCGAVWCRAVSCGAVRVERSVPCGAVPSRARRALPFADEPAA